MRTEPQLQATLPPPELLTPNSDMLLVRLDDEFVQQDGATMTEGGILVPKEGDASAGQVAATGTIVRAGDECKFKVGQRVVIIKNAGIHCPLPEDRSDEQGRWVLVADQFETLGAWDAPVKAKKANRTARSNSRSPTGRSRKAAARPG